MSAIYLNLQEIDSYISGSQTLSFLLPYPILLQPINLFPLYANENNISLTQNNIDSISYQDLINWFSNFLQSEINNIQDYNAKLAAENQKSALDQLLGTLSNALSFFSSPVFWIVLGLIIIGIVVLKII